jgi:hypothetical protein
MLHGSEYFSASELTCKCGCGFGSLGGDIAVDLIFSLHIIRKLLAVPFVLTSGARCAQHNTAVGGSVKSTHLAGVKGRCTPGYEGRCRAVDIQTTAWSTELRGRAVSLALAMGLRVGIASTFIHLDVEDSPYYREGIWNYSSSEDSSI